MQRHVKILFFCILVNSFVLASASVGGVRKQKNLKRTKCGLRKEKNAVVFGMARALEEGLSGL